MAKVPTSTSRPHLVTTYKSKKTSPPSRNLPSSLKNSVSKTSLQGQEKKASIVSKLKGSAIANGINDEESMGSDDDDDEEEEEFDPKIKALTEQFRSTSQHAKLKPLNETPTTSRTMVNRNNARFPFPNASASRVQSNGKPRGVVVEHTDDEDDEDELAFRNDDDDDEMEDVRFEVMDSKHTTKPRFTLDIANMGKENTAVRVTTGGHARERDHGRKFGQVIQTHADRSHFTRGKPYDPPAARHSTKSRMQPDLQPLYASQSARNMPTRTYDMASSDTDVTETSNDRRVFGIQGNHHDRVVKEHRREETSREIKHRIEESDDEQSSDEEEEGRGHGHLRAETEIDVRHVQSVFKGIRKKMKAHENKVSGKLIEELQPIHRATEKVYKLLGGTYTERFLNQQSMMEKALENQHETLYSLRQHMVDKQEYLKESAIELQGSYDKIQERKQKLLEKAMKQLTDLEKKQAKDIENSQAEMERLRDKSKAKAEKLLDPAALHAKFAKQRKYIFQEVGI